jgi:hypothetical protein
VLFEGTEAMLQVGISPTTVTVAVQVLVLPLASFTVSVTVCVPISAQLKSVLDNEKVNGLQLSVLPLLIIAVVIEAAPFLSVMVAFWHTATGGVMSLTVIV